MEKVPSKFVWTGGVLLLLLFCTTILLPRFLTQSYVSEPAAEERFAGSEVVVEEEPKVLHLETPEPLKAIYMTACVAATPSWRESLKQFVVDTELNAVVIDIKDATGSISFPTAIESGGRGCVVSDMKEFLTSLHEAGVYVIGRISVFQDPFYATAHPELAVKSKSTGGVWKDNKGLSFIDVGAKPYWDHVIEIAEESYAVGFDELNFDYIRYPSDGNMQDTYYSWSYASTTASTTSYTKPEMLENFFSYLHDKLKESGAVLSADLFGMTTTIENDMGIGQVLERALPYFDYVAPMVYPSHYPNGWHGFANPAANPYEVIKIAMQAGRDREVRLNIANGLATSTPSKLRPWLQDFDLGATYDVAKVQDQIRATYEVGLTSWMMWSAANDYTKEAYLSE